MIGSSFRGGPKAGERIGAEGARLPDIIINTFPPEAIPSFAEAVRG
jgi:hypothetical protein